MRKVRIGLCLICKDDVSAILKDDIDEIDYIDQSLCRHAVIVEDDTVIVNDDELEELDED